MLIHYKDGRVVAGILLSLKGNQMRVAIQDADDVEEFQLLNGLWISECRQTVTFDFPTAVFQAIGMIPDAKNMVSQPDFLWQWASTEGPDVDPLN